MLFLCRIILKHIENKKGFKGSGGMLPQKNLKILHTTVTILALFDQFLSKFCLTFLPLNLNVSPNMMHFVCAYSSIVLRV